MDSLFLQKLYNKWDFKACEARKSAVYLGVNEHFEGERKVAIKPRARACAMPRRSNQKELNAEITLLDSFYLTGLISFTRNCVVTIPR